MELLRRDLKAPTVRAESVRALEVPEGMVWISMEDGLHCRAGAEVSIVGAHVMGRRALIMEAPGRYIAAKLVSVTEGSWCAGANHHRHRLSAATGRSTVRSQWQQR
eukprot:1242829-Amphidinium_carterae.1